MTDDDVMEMILTVEGSIFIMQNTTLSMLLQNVHKLSFLIKKKLVKD